MNQYLQNNMSNIEENETKMVISLFLQQQKKMMEMMQSITDSVDNVLDQADVKIKELSNKVEYLQNNAIKKDENKAANN